MSRPITPIIRKAAEIVFTSDPLNMLNAPGMREKYLPTQIRIKE